jgi:hypothetical protein
MGMLLTAFGEWFSSSIMIKWKILKRNNGKEGY